MKRLIGLVLVAVAPIGLVACAGESADAPAAAGVEVDETPVDVSAATTPAENVAPVRLVARADVVISAPTVLWFWAPG